MTDIAIRVQNRSKCYQIYDNPSDRLKQFVLPSLQRLTNGRIVAWAGYWWFQRTRKGFADAL